MSGDARANCTLFLRELTAEMTSWLALTALNFSGHRHFPFHVFLTSRWRNKYWRASNAAPRVIKHYREQSPFFPGSAPFSPPSAELGVTADPSWRRCTVAPSMARSVGPALALFPTAAGRR